MMESATQSAAGKQGRVLVIDDEPLMQKLMARLLRSRGYEVFVAGGDNETAAVIARGGYDLVITDLHMPQLNGVSVLRLVRDKDPDLPVILVTAAPTTETAISAVKLRATAYLTKPIDANKLADEVQQALALAELSRVRREAHAILSAHPPENHQALNAQFDGALDKLFLAYQPIVSWPERRAYGYEALVRSAEPSLGNPGALFGAAETLNRAQDLGRIIRRKVVEPPLADGVHLFVNLHADDLLDETLFDAGTSFSAMAPRIVLEITERAQLEGVKDVGSRIERLRGLGFRIAVDDIGAGYSGLNSFALLKPDIVKLDMTLVRDIHHDPVKRRLASAVVNLCRDLSISVVGEGVETIGERDVLLEIGCDLLQGYLFGRPGAPFQAPSFQSS
jgi:EAL domain-containing protein (putative c-di-GMP-specific phosphodiesterase class I)